MRPQSLYFLFSPLTLIKGVGGATAEALHRLLPTANVIGGGGTPIVRDLLFHLPIGIVDRRFTCPLSSAPDGVIATFVVTVDQHMAPAGSRGRFGGQHKRPYKVLCSNDTGTITLVFFNARDDYIKSVLPVGQQRVISGRTENQNYHLQMTHPDIIAPVAQLAEVQKSDAIYPLTIGLTSKRIARIVEGALARLPALPEWIAPETMERKRWPSWGEALVAAHHPQLPEDVLPTSPPRQRLAYDEILAHQFHLSLLRQHMQKLTGERIIGNGKLTTLLREKLPFRLTPGQEAVLKEIESDMGSGSRMTRLLQGDVGSGKTVVALLAMLRAVEQGLQVAFMVPTEIIAHQHFETLTKLTAGLGVNVSLLTGRVKGKAREAVLADMRAGQVHITVGTHALFQDHVEFARLALVVIDEQHRFGVGQRMALTAKGTAPHLLHMTATPIPRSLTMMLYGDMDCSLLKEKPAERLPITTRVIPLSRYEEMMDRLQTALSRGEKVYWICPLIDEPTQVGEMDYTPETDIAAAETRFAEFKARFGETLVGMVHGRMKADARDRVMEGFAGGATRLLVATTVVEVGVDVRDATIIVIEKAERFGLSQLHQLRGRVGRGDKQSACVLLCSDKAGEVAKARLSILRESEDGFRIAEEDLAIRGGGDVLGTRQSGLPRFIFMDFAHHQELVAEAREEAARRLAEDPGLTNKNSSAMRIALELFGWEHEALRS